MILLTGGSGRLGTELQKHLKCIAPTRQEFDILDPKWPEGVSTVVHCAAYTDVLRAETDAHTCYDVNVVGTRNMTEYPLVYISTEYVFGGEEGNYNEKAKTRPQNVYAATKYVGECEANWAPRSLVIRCLFKERPFRHEKACVDQWTSGDYVDVIAPLIAQCVGWFQAGHFRDHDTIHVGTGRKSTFELALQTRDVEPIHRDELAVKLPRDTSLNCDRFYKMCEDFSAGY